MSISEEEMRKLYNDMPTVQLREKGHLEKHSHTLTTMLKNLAVSYDKIGRGN